MDDVQAALTLFANRLTSQSPLSLSEIEAIQRLPGTAVATRPYTRLVRRGDVPDAVHLVAEGAVGHYAMAQNGVRACVGFYLPGDACDLDCLLSPRSLLELETLRKTRVVRIAHHDLKSICGAYPAVAQAFARENIAQASILSEWLLNIGRRSARARVAHLLCELAVRLERVDRGSRERFRMFATQAVFGDILGLTSVHMNRVFRSLREDGIAQVNAGIVEIHNWAELARIAGFKADYLSLEPMSVTSPNLEGGFQRLRRLPPSRTNESERGMALSPATSDPGTRMLG